jgi:hypothetical protein
LPIRIHLLSLVVFRIANRIYRFYSSGVTHSTNNKKKPMSSPSSSSFFAHADQSRASGASSNGPTWTASATNFFNTVAFNVKHFQAQPAVKPHAAHKKREEDDAYRTYALWGCK